MTAKTKKILTILLTILGLTAFVITPLAWFANYWAEHSAGFKPGENAGLPDIDMWMYNSAEDLVANSSLVAGWVQVPDAVAGENTTNSNNGLEKTDSAYIIPSAPATTNNGISFTLNQMHFGVVDNLISLKEDNLIYIRLKVDAKKTGARHLTVKLDYNAVNPAAPTLNELYESVTLYGTPVDSDDLQLIKHGTSDTTYSELKKVITFPATKDANNNDTANADITSEKSQFMQIACAVTTNEKVIPGGTGEYISVDTLDFTNFAVVGNQVEINVADALSTKTTVNDVTTTTPFAGDYYYVYLKIAPRLEFFVSQENLLDQFVPSYIFFDTKLKIELY
jgi:hypothetical protein